MRPRRIAAAVAAAGTVLALAAGGAGAAPRVPEIYVGLFLHDVTKLDLKDGLFDVAADLWVKWAGDFDPEALRIANGAELERTLLGSEVDGTWRSVRWEIRGTLRGEFPLQHFPFDAQTIAVVLELDERLGHLVPDLASSGMRERFSITGWLYEPSFRPRVDETTYRSDLGVLAAEGSPTATRRVAFEVTLSRPPVMIGLKLFLPLAIILLVALIALFLPPDFVDPRSAIGVTALLSCFAFQFTLSDAMPDVSYLTTADSLFVVAYAVTCLGLLETIVSFALHRSDKPRAARAVDRVCLVAFPAAIVSAVFLLFPHGGDAAPAIRSSVPETPRHASAPKELRIGTTAPLNNLLATPIASTYLWGAVHEETDGTRLPMLVDAVPSLANENVRFLAGGSIEVTWKLRPGLRWSDGQPLLASDFAFVFEASPNPHVIKVEARGVDRLVLTWDDRLAAALDGVWPWPRRLLANVLAEGGYDAMTEHRRKTPVPSTGPYHVTAWKPGERLVVEANPHFVGLPPNIARVEVIRFPDGPAALAAFERGEVDILAPNTISPDLAREFATRRPDAVRIRPSAVQVYLQPDLTHPLLARLDVRRAVLMAIDRDKLAREVYGPAGRVSHVPVAGDPPPGVTPVPYDPAGARKLLEAAGAVGVPLVLRHGKDEMDKMFTARVRADLVAAGFAITLEEVEKTADLHRKRNHGGLLWFAAIGERDAAPEKYWNVPLVDGRYDPAHRSDAYDDRIAALVAREMRALYPERRDQLRDALFAAYAERLPNLPLLFATERLVADPRLKGWEHDDPTVRFGADLERWWFEGAPEKKP